ncbi:TonB-dependent receptor plug domain-containing protein [Arcobacter aquimarinus]|uniref:TonB-dependent receptor n=1 Tax=Arcobacter aquimarinus TaxID=1315211 RepID=A0AAE7B5W7_9BACT|nr:TonB-dependent receptor [Arcobacter aquimarinus]QKE26097.1 TonB-dependent receptor [Arcobacter aquimarinus]RXI36209.1 TonB-dependent receptor [Arcobacter aquimarinus]
MQKKLSISLVASFLLATTNLFSAQNLETITVTSATKTTQSIKDVTSNVDVITAQEIEERKFTTVVEALNTLPGISFVSNGGMGNTSSVFLRGMDSKRILVLIDGVKYQDPSNTSGAAFSHLMISDIERIEVIKGAQSSVWGADASAGVINIITKEAKNGVHVNFNSEFGSFQTKKYGMSVSNKTDKYSVKLSADRILTDGFSSQTPFGDRVDDYEKDGYRNTTVNLKGSYNITDEDSINLSYHHINSFVEYDDWNAPNANLHSDNESNLYSLGYNKNYKNHNIKLKYDISEFEKKELEATNSWQVRDYNGKVKLLDLTDNISYFDKDSLLIGFSHEKTEVDYIKGNNATNKDDNTNKAIYITNTNYLGDFAITESLRRDDYSNFGSKYTGKIGVKYNVNEDLSFNANYGTAYNAPNIINILNPWGISNPDLEPEKIKGFDISSTYKDFTLTYFKNKIDNLMNWQSSKYVNIDGTSTIEGYEAKYSKLIIEDLLLNLNYTYLSAKDSQERELARRPKNQVGFGVDYYGISNLHFNINGQYIGERYDGANKTGRETGNYTLWNSVINYEINKTFSTYLKVDNIFNKYYQTIDGYATAQRSAYVGLKANF